MKPLQHMSETELREEIAELEANPSMGIVAVIRLRVLKRHLCTLVAARFAGMRPELLRVRIERLRRQGSSDELKLAMLVAEQLDIWLLPELPDGEQYTRRQLHLHAMRPEQLKTAIGRMRKTSKLYQQAAPIARQRGLIETLEAES